MAHEAAGLGVDGIIAGMKPLEFFESLSQTLAHFPWRNTALALRQRFKEDQLALTASSLTYTTVLSLVPIFTVVLAIFTAFPMFGKLQVVLQKWLVESLIPENISRQVMGYMAQFASQSSKLGLLGLVLVLTSALMLILTFDHTLNNIWRVKTPRPLAQRVLIYWAALTLGPLLLGASLTLTSTVLSASTAAVGGSSRGLGLAVGFLEFCLLAVGAAAQFHYVPNTEVKWAHAFAGGLFVAMGIELAKKLLGLYLASFSTYSMVYGAFAAVPILLLWIYVVWAIVLLGAVLAAYLPSLLAGVARPGDTPGWQFQMALEVLQALFTRGRQKLPALQRNDLAALLQVGSVQLEPVLESLVELRWVGQLEPVDQHDSTRLILLTDPDTTLLKPLAQRWLIHHDDSVVKFWENAKLSVLTLRDVLI